MPASEPQNLWISASEREAVMTCLRAIEQGVLQLRYDRFQLKAAERAACQSVKQGCRKLRALLDALEDDEEE